MRIHQLSFGLLILGLMACNSNYQEKQSDKSKNYPDIQIASAMKNVMWKGELDGKILLDTISNKKGLYGIGPASFLRGELLIRDGEGYVSKVTSDTTMAVENTLNTSAPFFVYGNVMEWKRIDLPPDLKSIPELEKFIDRRTTDFKRPFAFKLEGNATKAMIHIQNLAEGTVVRSPQEAHQGQINYELKNENVEIVGFFSTEHQGIFTHHDSFIHMHLITDDKSKMGHLDELEIGEMKLYLPMR